MSSINQSLDAVRRILLKPQENSPNADTLLGAILDEFQNLYNELGNSSVAWTVKEFTLNNCGGSGRDCRVGENVGKILFVSNVAGAYSYPIEFTDLEDNCSDWWNFEPIVSDRLEDYGYWNTISKIAFYRKNGALYARVPQVYANGTIKVTAATGKFCGDLQTCPVLPEYHNLAHVRAAINVLPDAEWWDDPNRNEAKRTNLMKTLPVQENRIYEQFRVAKRGLTASDATIVETIDDYY